MMKKLLEISLFTHDGEDVLLASAYLQRTFSREKGNGQPECTISEQARGIGKSLGSKTGARFTARSTCYTAKTVNVHSSRAWTEITVAGRQI